MWAKLSSIADVGALVAAWPGADWQGLLADAARFGQKRSLLVGVAVANLLLASPMPEVFRDAARWIRGSRDWRRRLLNGCGRGFP
jgi:hypothetical protein